MLVNVTSLGMRGEDLPAQVGLDALEPEVVADVVYGARADGALPLGASSGARGWSTGSRCCCARAPAASSAGPAGRRRST